MKISVLGKVDRRALFEIFKKSKSAIAVNDIPEIFASFGNFLQGLFLEKFTQLQFY